MMKLLSFNYTDDLMEEIPDTEEPEGRSMGLDTLLGLGQNSTNSTVTDGQLLHSMRYNAVAGVTCLVVFGFLNSVFKMYRIRLSLRRVTEKPPGLPKWKLSMLWMWIWRAITVSDEKLLLTAGLDAFMLVKTFGIGIQLFFPLAIIGCCVLIPIHESTEYAHDMAFGNNSAPGTFIRMTASNVKPGSPQLWIHFFCVYVFVFYALLLLDWHLKRYIRLRHRYLSAGGELNMWRTKYFEESSAPEERHHLSRFYSFINRAKNMFKDNAPDLRKGLLTKISTLRRDQTQSVVEELDETPRFLSSRSLVRRRVIHAEDDLRRELLDNDSHTDGNAAVDMGSTSAAHNAGNEIQTVKEERESEITPTQQDILPIMRQSKRMSHALTLNTLSLPLDLPSAAINRLASDTRPANGSVSRHGSQQHDHSIWKWWLLRDGVTEIHSACASDQSRASFDLPRPSVRYLKTVNTEDLQTGAEMAVSAQQYCVLLTNFPDIDLSKEEDSACSNNWISKAFQWFFREISAEKLFLGSHLKKTASLIGFGVPKDPVQISSSLGDVSVSETNREPISKERNNSWHRIKKMLNAGRLVNVEKNVVEESFRTLFPNDFVQAVPIRNHKELDMLVSRWDRLMGTLEHYENYERRTGKRRQIARSKWWSWLFFYQLGYVPPADAILLYTRLIYDLEKQIARLREQILSGPHSPSWIVIFRTQSAAAIASQALLHSESGDMCHAEPAPGPDEINWQALWKSPTEKYIRRVLVAPLIFVLIAFPLGIFAGSLSSLNTFLCEDREADHYWESYCGHDMYQRLINGWIPPILVSVWQNMVMPNGLYYLVLASAKCVSLSQLERNIAQLFFQWDVLNIFLGGMLGGSVLYKINSAVKHPADMMHLIGVALPASSNFFVNYVCLRAFFLVPYQLLVPHPGIWYFLLRLGGCCGFARTSRDRAYLWAPRSVRYGREYGLILLIFLITLGYSVISPIIVPVALVYFFVSWLVWRYQILYVFVRKYESGGRMWPMLVSRILFSLWLFQFLTACVLLTKEAYWQAAILWFTVPFILHRFHVYCNYRFEPGLNYIPLEMAHYAPPAKIDPKVYTPPALLKNCAGWHPEYMKAWEGWGSPAYTI